MKVKMLLAVISAIAICSCSGRSKEEQKAYTDSLFHVLSCSPTLFDSPYTLDDQLNACELLIKEFPDKKEKFDKIKNRIHHLKEGKDLELY